MFAYCKNNPVNEIDESGTLSIKSAFKKIGGWVNKVFRRVAEVKNVERERENWAGYHTSGNVASAWSGDSNGNYLYIKKSATIGNTAHPSISTSVGLASYSNGVGSSIEFNNNEISLSVTTSNNTTYTFTHNARGDSLQILQSGQNSSIGIGEFEEYGVSRLGEYAAAGAVYVMAMYPQYAPAIASKADKIYVAVQNFFSMIPSYATN